jgi:hypothetical protein
MSEAIMLRIDEPEDRVLRHPVSRIRGWCGTPYWADAAQMELRVGDACVLWQTQERPDVADKHPELSVSGFVADLDLAQYLYAIRCGELVVTAALPRGPELKTVFTVSPGLTAKCLAAAAGV